MSAKKRASAVTCVVEDCDQLHRYQDGYCQNHRKNRTAIEAEEVEEDGGKNMAHDQASSIFDGAGGGIPAGLSLPCHEEEEFKQSWCVGDGSRFNVRCGPNYKKNGTKAPSAQPFYQCIGIDIFGSPEKIDHMSERVQLPPVPEGATGLALPPFFVVNVQMPWNAPSLKGKTPPVGSSFVYYFVLTPDTVQMLSGPEDAYSPALKVLCRYVAQCDEPNSKVKSDFKVIAIVTNPKEVGMKSLIGKYNGKPVLIKKTGTIYKGENYIEMDVNVHAFAMLTRKSLKETHGSLSKMKVCLGFVIQGTADDELPEQVFGCVQLNCVDFTKAPPFPTN
jgi:hypothetical protein